MKILIIGPFPNPLYGVSLSNFVFNSGLLRKGYKVEKIDTAGGKKIDSKVGAWDVRKLSFVKSYLQIFKVVKSDVTYCTSGQTFFGIVKYAPFIFLANLTGKKAIIHVKGGYLKDSYNQMGSFKKWIVRKVLSSYDGGIVLSKSLRFLLEGFLPDDKIFIQHNFIQDTLMISKTEILKHKGYGELRIIYLSNLMKEKGIGELLSALNELNKRDIPFKAKIAGHIPMDDEAIVSRIEELDHVEYVGVVREQAKTELLSWGNLFCLPTYYPMEGQPISIIESMGFGNVILTTKHAGIPDVVSDKNGVFVEKRDVTSIVNQLAHLSNNLTWLEATGNYNMNEAQELYTEEAFIEGLLDIMKRV